jgi:hypothetical protein
VRPAWLANAMAPTGGSGFHLSHAVALPVGALVLVVGVLLVVFNAKVGPVLNRLVINRNATSATRLYQRGASGRTPIMTFIGIGWIAIGALMVVTSL